MESHGVTAVTASPRTNGPVTASIASAELSVAYSVPRAPAGHAVSSTAAGRSSTDSHWPAVPGWWTFQALFARVPAVANAHYLYGFLLYASEPEDAATEFQQELEVNPKNTAAEVMLAWIPLLQNDGKDALPYAEKAAKEDPSLPSAQLVLGRALSESGDPKDAIEHLEKTAQLQLVQNQTSRTTI